jgi:hypothetical protein
MATGSLAVDFAEEVALCIEAVVFAGPVETAGDDAGFGGLAQIIFSMLGSAVSEDLVTTILCVGASEV